MRDRLYAAHPDAERAIPMGRRLNPEEEVSEKRKLKAYLDAQVEQAAAREGKQADADLQQLTLDEYRAKAQASVAAANARTMQVTQQRHQAEERARESGDKAEALRREHASLYREAEVSVLVS